MLPLFAWFWFAANPLPPPRLSIPKGEVPRTIHKDAVPPSKVPDLGPFFPLSPRR
jgi:hypothetical protein